MLRQDYIGRLIQQLAEALARIARAARAGRVDEAEQELAEAERALGLFAGMDRLDEKSVAMMLGGADKVVLAAQIFEQRAAIAAQRGDAAAAARLRRRAAALLDHAQPKELATEAAELRARLAN